MYAGLHSASPLQQHHILRPFGCRPGQDRNGSHLPELQKPQSAPSCHRPSTETSHRPGPAPAGLTCSRLGFSGSTSSSNVIAYPHDCASECSRKKSPSASVSRTASATAAASNSCGTFVACFSGGHPETGQTCWRALSWENLVAAEVLSGRAHTNKCRQTCQWLEPEGFGKS